MNVESTKKIRKWIYLNEESKNLLNQKYPGIHSVKKSDHITLESPILNTDKLGDIVTFKAIAYAKDDMGEALQVELPSDVFCKNEIPHITISVREDINPRYSNELLAEKADKIEPFELEGRIAIQES